MFLMLSQIFIQVCRSRLLCSLHHKDDIDWQRTVLSDILTHRCQTRRNVALVIIDSAAIHNTVVDRQSKRIVGPRLVIIGRHCIIVVIENDSLGFRIVRLKLCQYKGSRVTVINHHFSTRGSENFSQIGSYLLEPNLLGKDRFFRNQGPQHLKIVLSHLIIFKLFNLFTLS